MGRWAIWAELLNRPERPETLPKEADLTGIQWDSADEDTRKHGTISTKRTDWVSLL